MAKRRRRAEINIVPLVDVLIVLIFFFLMTTQFRNLHVVQITPPQMQTSTPDRAGQELSIVITASGNYLIDGRPATEDGLEDALASAAARTPPPAILVQVDEDAPSKRFFFVLDQTRALNLRDFRVLTRQ